MYSSFGMRVNPKFPVKWNEQPKCFKPAEAKDMGVAMTVVDIQPEIVADPPIVHIKEETVSAPVTESSESNEDTVKKILKKKTKKVT